MFTGLVKEIGVIRTVEYKSDSAILVIFAPDLAPQISIGDSVCVSGVCLTATSVGIDYFSADVMVQTLKMTSLRTIQTATKLNLELATRASDRLGGHIVQGHVDGVGIVKALTPGEKWARLDIEVPSELTRYIVNQGSIALDGVSLTVGEIDDSTSTVTLWLIPETLERTNLSSKNPGDPINIEVDILAKYVERLIEKRSQ